MKKIKILLLLHELSHTGAPRIAIETLERMRDGIEVRTVSLYPGPLAERVRALGPLYLARLSRFRTAKEAILFLQSGIAQMVWGPLLTGWNPDIIYVNSVASLPLAQQIPLPKAPVLLHVHELDSLLDWYDRRTRLLREWPDRYIAVSCAVQRTLTANYDIPLEKIALIHEFFDEALLLKAIKKEVSSLPRTPPFVVGGAGRIQWRKGIELWLRTAAHMKETMGEGSFRFVWVGGEGDVREQEMRVTAAKLGVASLVEIVPMTSDPMPQYHRFDVFLMTSWEDPCPIVVLENMALGKPVVCVAEGGGAAEEVGDTGIVVAGFDEKALAEAIRGLVTAPERLYALSEATRERAMTHFTASVQVPKIQHEIQRLVHPH